MERNLILAGGIVLGAVVGSFLGAALERLPAGRSVLTGRSGCDRCGTTLAVQDLVPVLSWLALRGRCRTCGGRIGAWQLACEVLGAGIAVVALMLAHDGMALAAMAFGWQLLLLALLDLRHLWLPRALTGILAVNGLLLAAGRSWSIHDPAPLFIALGGGVLGWSMLWAVAAGYRGVRGREGMGGGDPPLLGAIGLWLGPQGVILSMLGGAIIGLLALVACRAWGRKIAVDTMLPLGTCLAAAAWPIFVVAGFE